MTTRLAAFTLGWLSSLAIVFLLLAGCDEQSHPSPGPGAKVSFGSADAGTAASTEPGAAPCSGAMAVPLLVKEPAGLRADGVPVSAVVPLPRGTFQDTTCLRVTDGAGQSVPAQFEVLTRWWADDGSLRHVQVHFRADVEPYTGPAAGEATYHLRDDGAGQAAADLGLRVDETGDAVTVETGPLRFTLSKRAFNLFDEVWLDQDGDGVFAPDERVVSSGATHGGVLTGRLPGDVQHDAQRDDVIFTVEEAGPLRAVIRVEAPTLFFGTDDHTHGFAARIYAYAGASHVKVDYQLQNSARNARYSWPLYFEELRLDVGLELDAGATVRVGLGDGTVLSRALDADGLFLAQTFHDAFSVYDRPYDEVIASGKQADGVIDVSDGQRGVTVAVRHFWQTWPNGLGVHPDGRVSVELFPSWSATWEEAQAGFNPTGLYWLEDMQHTLKEVLFHFHGPGVTDQAIVERARRFTRHPVVAVPTAWHQQCRATVDMGGLIPIAKPIADPDTSRLPAYPESWYTSSSETKYHFGWDNFALDVHRKDAAAQAGGWPYGRTRFVATGNPADYFSAEELALGELNVRPHWLAGYTHAADYALLRLGGPCPYAAPSIRCCKCEDNLYGQLAAPLLPQTSRDSRPRDDSHAWYYHMEEIYYLTGDPWIRDWYRFVGEYLEAYLRDPSKWSLASRAVAHYAAWALQSYRVTGKQEIVELMRDLVRDKLAVELDPRYGFRNSMCCGAFGESAFQAGFLARALISYMEEIRRSRPQAYAEAFNVLSGMMEWNENHANFAYYLDATKGEVGTSSGTSLTFTDPQAWYYWNTGRRRFRDHLLAYLDLGINGGALPYGEVEKMGVKRDWAGEWEGRWVQWIRENDKADATPPAAVKDLSAVAEGDRVTLTWTDPPDVSRRHLVLSAKPIAARMTDAAACANWWSAEVLVVDLAPRPGEARTLTVTSKTAGAGGAVYAALFSFDAEENMSEMSNLACTEPPCDACPAK